MNIESHGYLNCDQYSHFKRENKMPLNARLTDIWAGVCVCHPIPVPMSGPIITASPNRNVNNLGQARLTDLTMGWCGHVGLIVAGSSLADTNNLQDARLTDPTAGCNIGVIVTGSPDHTTEG